MYCSKCGANLSPGSAFCGSCGTPAGLPVAAVPNVPVAPGYPAAMAAPMYPGPASLSPTRAFSYAGFWLRFVAALIDGLILSVAVMVLILPLVFLTSFAGTMGQLADRHGQPDPAMIGALLGIILVFVGISIVVQWLYFAYLESGEKQATWGKQVLGLYVTDLQGNRVTFGRASGRFFGKLVTGMIPLAIGYIMAGFTERKQALHDMIASCLVLRR